MVQQDIHCTYLAESPSSNRAILPTLTCPSLSHRERILVAFNMSLRRESLQLEDPEKKGAVPVEPSSLGDHAKGRQFSVDPHDVGMIEADQGKLHRNLKGRHMQMIAM